MKLNVHRFLTATSLLLAAARVSGATEKDNTRSVADFERNLNEQLCRCQAPWESHFYNRRLQEDDSKEPSRHRELYHHYDYTQAYLDGDLYVIEGVKVLPHDQCLFRRMLEETSSVSEDALEMDGVEKSDGLSESDESDTEQERDLTYYYGGHHQGTLTSLELQQYC